MEAARLTGAANGVFAMATPTDTHAEPVNTEKPTQGIFMGYLALGLLIFALLVAAVSIYAGLSNGPA
jgi:hypothetical protein